MNDDAVTNRSRLPQYYGRLALAIVGLGAPLVLLAIIAERHRAAIPRGHVGQLLEQPGATWRLFLNTLPGLLAVLAAFALTSTFVASLYRLNKKSEGAGHLWRSVFGRSSFGPSVHVAEGEIKTNDQHVLRRLGGPGGILVNNDSAAVLARGGRLTRVLGPGEIDELRPFEQVYDALDVRPMRWEWCVHALSREGIPVRLSVDVHFRIRTDGRAPSDKTPYPAANDAIFRAATGRWMRAQMESEDNEAFDWARRVVLSDTEESVRSTIARYSVDALIDPDELAACVSRQRTGSTETSSEARGMPMLTSGQPTAPGRLDHPRQTLEMEIVAALRKLAGPLGVEINQVRLGAIRVDDDIQAQWIEAWMSRWRYWTLVQRQKGEATREQLRETARAQAQVDMITAVAQAFQDSVSRDARVPAQLLVMRLLEVFDRTTIGEKMYLPDHALNTLERLRRLLE